jgi:hypothetical protein
VREFRPPPRPDFSSPAPVVSESMARAMARPEGRGRAGLAAFVAMLAGGALALALAVASFAQVSSEPVAREAHEAGIVAITEVDALIALHASELQAQLDEGAARVTLPGYPVLEVARFREALVASSAALVYERGASALREPEGASVGGSLTLRGVEATLDWLTRERHSWGRMALWPLGAISALLVLVALGSARGLGRLVALGGALAWAGVLVVAATLLVRSRVGGTADGVEGSMATEYARIWRTLLDVPLENGLIALVLGAALAIPAAVIARRSHHRVEERGPAW